jgi:hypothetical protein
VKERNSITNVSSGSFSASDGLGGSVVEDSDASLITARSKDGGVASGEHCRVDRLNGVVNLVDKTSGAGSDQSGDASHFLSRENTAQDVFRSLSEFLFKAASRNGDVVIDRHNIIITDLVVSVESIVFRLSDRILSASLEDSNNFSDCGSFWNFSEESRFEDSDGVNGDRSRK